MGFDQKFRFFHLFWAGYGRLTTIKGDIYDGQWLNDMKEGAGEFYSHESDRVFIGEWISGIPKTGIYSTFSTTTNNRFAQNKFTKLKLLDVDDVVLKEIDKIRSHKEKKQKIYRKINSGKFKNCFP